MDKRKLNKMTVNEIVEVALRLRNVADASETEFIEFLMEVESHSSWQAAVLTTGTFESFLVRFHICSAERYTRSKRALSEVPRGLLEKIGLAAAKQAIRVEDSGKRASVLESMLNVAKDSSGPLTDWTARKVLQEVTDAPRVRVSRVDELESENRELRAKLAVLERENRELREHLGAYEAAGGARNSNKHAPKGRQGPRHATV